MDDYRLFSWGANSHGQLGHGDTAEEELLTPREVDLSLCGLEAGRIRKVVGGAGHSLILDESGGVFGCGWTDKGQAGAERPSSRFRRLEALDGHRVVDVACGWDSSMALTERGELFAWGSNLHGQLGLARLRSTSAPTRVELGAPVAQMAIGLRHSVLVTRESKVLASGAAAKGQLGFELAGAKSSDRFVEVPDLRDVKGVSCGQHHSVVVTRDGVVLSWGDNKHGQLGVEPGSHRVLFRPIEVARFEHAVDKVSCGWTHSLCLAEGRLFFWGRNTYGQLGRTRTTAADELWRPGTPTTPMRARQVSVGSEHNVVLTDDGAILTWGWNEHGNCGNGDAKDVFEPTRVLLPDCSGVLVGAGAGHSFALVKTKS